MARLRWTWDKLRAGQIVSFRFNNKFRTVFVLNPKYRKVNKDGTISETLHGIELKLSRNVILSLTEIRRLILKSGTVGALVYENNTQYYGVRLGDPEKTYRKIKPLIKDKGVYKRYSYDKAKRSQLYLEDFNFPNKPKEK